MTPERGRRGGRLHAGRGPPAGHATATGWSGWCAASAARCASCSSARPGSTTAASRTTLELTEQGAVFRTADAAADPARRRAGAMQRHGDDVPRRADAAGRPGRRGGAGVGRRRPTADAWPAEELLGLFDRHGAVLARLAGPLDLPGPLARDGRPLGHHPQADDLRPDRRAGRRAHRRPARAGRRRAQLGLPLHLDPRRLVLGPCPARAGLHRGGRGVRALAARPGRRAGRARRRGR